MQADVPGALRAQAATLLALADALEALVAPPKRRRGRPRKAAPIATPADLATLSALGVRVGGERRVR